MRRRCSVDAEWIVAKKDWQEAKKRQKAREASTDGPASLDAGHPSQEMPASYQPEMDQMRCILYAHGGKKALFASLIDFN